MKDAGSFKSYMADQQLKTLVAMHHLKPDGRYGYTNEAGDPVRVRTANIDAHEKRHRPGLFTLSRDSHDRLVASGGHYLFILYRMDQFGGDALVKHVMRPASDFAVSGGKIAKIHHRDIFDGVKG